MPFQAEHIHYDRHKLPLQELCVWFSWCLQWPLTPKQSEVSKTCRPLSLAVTRKELNIYFLHSQLELIPTRWLATKNKVIKLTTHAYLRLVCEGRVSFVYGYETQAKSRATFDWLWWIMEKGGGHEIMLTEPPLFCTDCSSQLSGDYGCCYFTLQLFIWCRPKQ